MRQGIIPEDAADYRGLLQAVALSRAQAVEAGLQNACQRAGDAHLNQTGGINLPFFFAFDDDAIFNQHFDQFFDVEGVAFGPADHHFTQNLGHLTGFLEDLGHQQAAVIP